MPYFPRKRRFRLPLLLALVLSTALFVYDTPARSARSASDVVSLSPLRVVSAVSAMTPESGIRVQLDRFAHARFTAAGRDLEVAFPISDVADLTLSLKQFTVVDRDARFLTGNSVGERPHPDVLLYRGSIVDEPGSHAYFAVTRQGSAGGFVVRANGERFVLAQSPSDAAAGEGAGIVIHRVSAALAAPDLPDGIAMCGIEIPDGLSMSAATAAAPAGIVPGLRVANVAIEADQEFYDLFGDLTAAENYIVLLIGAVSDIYIRDINTRLNLVFARVWPIGGEPFSADNLGGFQSYYMNNEDTSDLNLVHLLSGRRDLSYGGVATVAGTCSGGAYGVDGYLNGSFPMPFGELSLGNWDVVVTAHEMGHNFGTFHTHDGFFPTIDDCGNGVPARGTIMSYCHIHAGYSLNTDMRFHARVQLQMELDVAPGSCHWYDCNGNGVPDDEDISLGTSPDLNSNGIPDECEDCDSNGVLNVDEIIAGSADANVNGIPDSCEPDCNSNGIPDDLDIALSSSDDLNGNNIPDECEPDCNGNAVADFRDIALGSVDDFDRNNIPDGCQDCDANGITDWIDLERQHNIYVADRSGFVREFHWASGYPIKSFGSGMLLTPFDVAFGPDRQLYVADNGTEIILRIDVDNDLPTVFVTAGSGGLAKPSALTFGPDGALYVVSSTMAKVFKYDGSTGASLGNFVIPGLGGLTSSYGLRFGPNGNLYVASENNTVIEYSGVDGTLIGVFVDNAAGQLVAPRDLTFTPGGNLLVASSGTSQVLEYNGATGAFVRVFSDDVQPSAVWGLEHGPNGNIFAMRSTGTLRLLELLPVGRYYRSRIRGDNAGFSQPSGIAFRPPSLLDCNGNGRLDFCDLAEDPGAVIGQAWYEDSDGDGYGNIAVSLTACLQPTDYVLDSSDCDDTNPNINPGMAESCNGLDDDCSGTPDDNVVGMPTWFADSDGDGFGADGVSLTQCDQPGGYVPTAGDCDDGNPDVNPGATEICNGIDDDCSGPPDSGAVDASVWYEDSDGDGFGDNATALSACVQPIGYVSDDSDCDDGDPAVKPGATELCDGLDNDCSGTPDDNICQCHADPVCDGVTNVLDVVQAVNVAFRSAPPVIDPLGSCVRENTDADCSGATDVLDVVRFVNVSFRSQDPAQNFCAACGP